MTTAAGSAVLLLLFSSCAPGQRAPGTGEPDAGELLREAASAARDVRTAIYRGRSEGIGAMSGRYASASGTVMLARIDDPDPIGARVRVEGEYRTVADEHRTFEAAYDGTAVFFVSHWQRTVTEADAQTYGRSSLEMAGWLLVDELVRREPFAKEIAAPTLRYEGRSEVEGVPCHVVSAEGGEGFGDATARWFLGVDDRLPRRVEWIWGEGEARGGTAFTITDLRTPAALDEDTFRLDLPPDYPVIEPENPPLLAVGEAAPHWELRDARGEPHRLSSYRGKLVLLDFWATWCGPCLEALPDLQKLHDRYVERGVAFFGIQCMDDADAASLLEKRGYSLSLLPDGDEVASAYRVSGLPTFYLIGREGRIVHRSSGYGPGAGERLAAAIDAALGDVGS